MIFERFSKVKLVSRSIHRQMQHAQVGQFCHRVGNYFHFGQSIADSEHKYQRAETRRAINQIWKFFESVFVFIWIHSLNRRIIMLHKYL